MPWKDRYTISDERGLADAEIKWPDGARLAVHVTLNLSPACGGGGIEPADLRTPETHYGLHGALDTLLPVLDRHNIRLTVAVPAVIAAIHADRMRALAAAGHEIVPNGWRNEDPALLDGPGIRTHRPRNAGADRDIRLAPTRLVLPPAALGQVCDWLCQFAHHGSTLGCGVRVVRQWPGR